MVDTSNKEDKGASQIEHPLKEDLKVVGEEDDELRNIYTTIRAGKDPITGALHMSEDEFVSRIKSRDQRIALEAQERELNKIPHRLLHIPEIWEHKQQRLATLKQSQKEE